MRKTLLILLLAALLAGVGFLINTSDPDVLGLESDLTDSSPSTSANSLPADLTGVEPSTAPSGVRKEVTVAPLANAEGSVAALSDNWPVRGRVLNAGGSPVVGAVVDTLGREETWRTGPDGRFELPSGAGEQTVRVVADGYLPWEETCHVPTAAGFDFGDLVLAPEVELTGWITDPQGQPVVGAAIFASSGPESDAVVFTRMDDKDEPQTHSDESGRFRVGGIAAGPWSLRVRHSNHPTVLEKGVSDGRSQELRIELAWGTQISGLVRELGSTLASSVEVRARRTDESSVATLGIWEVRRTDVGQDGAFALGGLDEGGVYELYLGKKGIEGYESQCSRRVQAKSGESDVLLVHGPGAEVVWRVVEDATGEPLESYKAKLVAANAAAFAAGRTSEGKHAEGVGSIAGLWPNEKGETFAFGIETAGFQPYSAPSLVLQPDQKLDLGTIRLELGPRLRVRVVDAATGEPQMGVQVALKFDPSDDPASASSRAREAFSNPGLGSNGQTAKTDAQGEALLALPPEGSSILTASHKDFAEQELAGITAENEGVQDLLVELTAGGSVRVRTVDADGNPLSAVGVEHRPGASGNTDGFAVFGMPGRRTDAQGEVVFTHLVPGEHRFRQAAGTSESAFAVSIEGMELDEDDWTVVTVLEGEELLLELRTEPLGILTGKLTEQGLVLAGAKLTLAEKDTGEGPNYSAFLSPPSAVSGPDGSYAFEGIKVGPKELTVEHANRAMSFRQDYSLEAGEQVLNLDLPLTIVEGRIVDEEGLAKPGVQVQARARGSSMGVTMVMASDGGGGAATSITMGGTAKLLVTTDEDGRYSLRGIQAGREFQVEASLTGYMASLSETLELQSGQVRTGVDVALAKGGKVVVQVQTTTGEPSTANILEAHYKGDGKFVEPRFASLDAGDAIFDDLKPGPWEIALRWFQGSPPDGADAEPTSIEVEEGGEHLVTVNG